MAERSQVSDKRVERSKAAVLAETYRQLTQSGIGGVSIDEVSRISGVSKTTIYRHWPSRSALLIDACSRLGEAREALDMGSLYKDVLAFATHLAEQLENSVWTSVYPSIIDAAERDAEIAAMQSQLHKGLMAPFDAIVERAKARGEIVSDKTADDLSALTIGPLFYRRWFSKVAIDGRFVEAIAAATVVAAGGRKGRSQA